MSKIGTINEQGYPAGQFGFNPLNEKDNQKILEENAKKDSDKKDNEEKE